MSRSGQKLKGMEGFHLNKGGDREDKRFISQIYRVKGFSHWLSKKLLT